MQLTRIGITMNGTPFEMPGIDSSELVMDHSVESLAAVIYSNCPACETGRETEILALVNELRGMLVYIIGDTAAFSHDARICKGVTRRVVESMLVDVQDLMIDLMSYSMESAEEFLADDIREEN